jgi:hypothetical protein
MIRFFLKLSLALFLLIAIDLPTRAAQDDDPFAEKGKPAPAAQARRNPTDGRIDFEASVTPQKVRRGETVTLTIKGILRPGFHTYPLTQRAPDQPEAQLSKLTIEDTPGLKPLWPVRDTRDRLNGRKTSWSSRRQRQDQKPLSCISIFKYATAFASWATTIPRLKSA